MTAENDDAQPVDPKDFLRALLHIDPKDAERVRDDSPATRPGKPPEGPRHDYGDDPED